MLGSLRWPDPTLRPRFDRGFNAKRDLASESVGRFWPVLTGKSTVSGSVGIGLIPGLKLGAIPLPPASTSLEHLPSELRKGSSGYRPESPASATKGDFESIVSAIPPRAPSGIAYAKRKPKCSVAVFSPYFVLEQRDSEATESPGRAQASLSATWARTKLADYATVMTRLWVALGFTPLEAVMVSV